MSRIKGKRVLPSIPGVEGGDATRSVRFNSDTVETSIGGTLTYGKTKGGRVSPSDSRLSNTTIPTLDLSESLDDLDVMDISETTKQSKLIRLAESSMNESPTNLSVEVRVRTNGALNKDIKRSIGKGAGNSPVKSDATLFKSPGLDRDVMESFNSPNASMKSRFGTPARRHTLDERLFGTPECYNVVQLDRQRYDFGYSDLINEESGDSCCGVTVAVRVRPYSQREMLDSNVRNVVQMEGNETTVTTDSGAVHRFLYDFSFWSFDQRDENFIGQERVYYTLAQPLLGKAFEGYNTCLFAYGQTGSGKSYSMMGHGEEVGIIPRFCEELFARADVAKDLNQVKIHVEISFFEIYNEKIHDLLASTKKEKGAKKTTLRVREHPSLGPYVEGLSTFVVNSFEDVNGWITLGNKNRATAATGMNDKSSRSHSVFTIVLTQTKSEILEGQEHDHSITSKINLVDLAGSERHSLSQVSGERLREGANINKSLLTLGKVISQLAEQSSLSNKRKKVFIPYRESVLTWLLKESLGGNSKTAMMATISPANHHVEESLSTLRYAQTARSIVNIARVNEDPKAKLIRELRAEIERLRACGVTSSEDVTSLVEIDSLKQQLLQKEQEMEQITRSWQERLRQSEERKQEEAKLLERAGVTLKVDNRLPNLVNLNEDPQLSEMLLYNIKEGITKVGRMGANSTHDIQLNGALIADNHCIINNMDSVISITPLGDSPTYVNGNLVSEPTVLHHGDRVILGGDHYFRFNHPIEVQRTRKGKGRVAPQEIKDFEFAKAELMGVQEARLQEARQKAQEEMLEEVEQAKRDAEIKLADMEKLMREESEEKVKEAEDVIHKLKKQKMMLEQEVVAGRKRQQLEAEAAQKASTQMIGERSRILELLNCQKQQDIQKLAEMKQKRAEKKQHHSDRQRSPAPMMVEPSTGKMDLYKIALQIREANKICQDLKKDTIFSREDFLDGEEVRTVIKVANTRLFVCTHWSLPKFDVKLEQLRDIYQNDTDSSADDDDVLNDPEDKWGKDISMMSPISPKNGKRRSVPSPSLRQALLSSTSSTGSFSRQDSKGDHCVRCSGPGVASLCKDVVNVALGQIKFSQLEESMADKTLHSCHALQVCLSQAVELPVTMETNNNHPSRVDLLQSTCVQLTGMYPVLVNNTTMWAALNQTLQSDLIHDLHTKIFDQVKVIGSQIVKFLQGCEGEVDSLVEESLSRLQDGLHGVCRLVGELALATDLPMSYLEDTTCTQGSQEVMSSICSSFFNGCDLFIDKTLQGALRTVEDFETKAQTINDLDLDNFHLGDMPQNVEICVSLCKDMLLKCQEVQVEVDISLLERSQHVPIEQSGSNYRRLQALILHISSLVEAVCLLVQHAEPVIQGVDCDITKVAKCAAMIQKCSEKLTTVCGRDLTRVHAGHNGVEEWSVLSTSQLEQLEYVSSDLNQCVNSLKASVQKVVELERASTMTTPRSKRLLPSCPAGVFSPRNAAKTEQTGS